MRDRGGIVTRSDDDEVVEHDLAIAGDDSRGKRGSFRCGIVRQAHCDIAALQKAQRLTAANGQDFDLRTICVSKAGRIAANRPEFSTLVVVATRTMRGVG